ncbi:MAG TPA: IPT/TIG domain-containing protein [Candidatus Acidoferrales bacterium]|nr:IPT/TIG domain-containing protein [Candidatus Acidoferrales bacterium]
MRESPLKVGSRSRLQPPASNISPGIHSRACLAVGLLTLLFARTASAQQTCYGYDETGRLVAAVNAQGQTIIYDHDAVGNIVDVRRNDATGPVAITFVTPATAVGGAQIVLLGVGFSSDATQDHVTIGGVAATVTAANTCSVTAIVPPGALAGPGSIQITTPSGSATYTGSFSLGVAVLVSPSTAEAVINQPLGFAATVAGATDQRVTWSVNGVAGGDATHGTIAPTGLYTAPAAVPTVTSVTVQATSVGSPGVRGQATVTIVSAPTGYANAAVSVMFGPLPPGGASAAPVSVAFDAAPPPLSVVALPVSVQFGALSAGGAEAAPVSVSFGALPGHVVQALPVSVANAAVISNVAPSSAARGAMVSVTLSGVNFTGATALAFLVDGAPDSHVTAANIAIGAGGTQLTANVAVDASALLGSHVVVVQTASGPSALESTGTNGFTVGP